MARTPGTEKGIDPDPRPRNEAVWELQGDLATVSCYAATEIDDFLLERAGHFEAVRRLIGMLRKSIVSVPEPASPKSLIDPTTAVAMKHALLDSDPGLEPSLTTIDELVREAGRVTDALTRIADNPREFGPEKRPEIEKLRSLCLSLANRALALEEPLDEREPEQFGCRGD